MRAHFFSKILTHSLEDNDFFPPHITAMNFSTQGWACLYTLGTVGGMLMQTAPEAQWARAPYVLLREQGCRGQSQVGLTTLGLPRV